MANRPNRPEPTTFSIPEPATNYTRIPHAFLDLAMRHLNGSEIGVYLAICRLTLGWNRPEWTGKSYEICDLAGIHHTSFHEAIRRLEEYGLIHVDRDPGRESTYAIRFAGDAVPPRKSGGVGTTDPPGKAEGYPPGKAEGSADPVLIDSSLKENIKETDNLPTPLELDRPIDKWAAEQARNYGLKLKINTAKKRQALTEADSPELRQAIIDCLERVGHGDDATDRVLRLVGPGYHPAIRAMRSMQDHNRTSPGASHARSYAPTTTTFTQHDPELQKSPLAAQIRDCRTDAGINARADDLLHMPAWKVAVLDALRLRDKTGFRERLTETFANLADDYRQGVTTDAIVESFFATEQQRAKQSKGGFDDIREYIASLSS